MGTATCEKLRKILLYMWYLERVGYFCVGTANEGAHNSSAMAIRNRICWHKKLENMFCGEWWCVLNPIYYYCWYHGFYLCLGLWRVKDVLFFCMKIQNVRIIHNIPYASSQNALIYHPNFFLKAFAITFVISRNANYLSLNCATRMLIIIAQCHVNTFHMNCNRF